MVELFFTLTYALFLPLRHTGANRVVIYYHGVLKEDAKQFEKQMTYLSKWCNVVTPSEIISASVQEEKTQVAITFDDAFVSALTYAVPILKRLNLAAGICVPAGDLGQAPRWVISSGCPDADEIVMSREQVAELSKDGFEILSHTNSHPILTNLDYTQLQNELVESKKKIAQIVGHEIQGISYPYGAYNTEVCDAAKTEGYQYGFTIEPRMLNGKTDKMQIGRFLVSPRDRLFIFQLKLKGAFEFTKYLRAAKKYLMTKLRLREYTH